MFCYNCGKPVASSYAFCPECGARISAPACDTQIMAEPVTYKNSDHKATEFLATTKKLLHWERNLWKIGGIIMTACGGFLMLISLIILGSGTPPTGPEGAELDPMSSLVLLIYLLYSSVFLAMGIVNLVTASRISPYLDNMEKNFAPTAKRLDSVGRIVYTIIFNGYAVIFYLINFVRLKENKDTVERIIQNQ